MGPQPGESPWHTYKANVVLEEFQTKQKCPPTTSHFQICLPAHFWSDLTQLPENDSPALSGYVHPGDTFVSVPLCHTAKCNPFVMRAVVTSGGSVLANLRPIETENWIYFWGLWWVSCRRAADFCQRLIKIEFWWDLWQSPVARSYFFIIGTSASREGSLRSEGADGDSSLCALGEPSYSPGTNCALLNKNIQ